MLEPCSSANLGDLGVVRLGEVREDPLVRALLARCRFPVPGTAVTLAVSGGPDSTAMAVLAAAAGLVVTCVHVDHGLRDGSAAEADVVAALARRFGLGVRAERVVVEPGPNLEARARAARYSVLPPDALVGHTADDQAETMLLNLVRGAGIEGLAGMRADARRPILDLRRAETHQLCADLGLAVVTDPTNDDPVHRRNRVRNELLPLLDDIAGRDVVAVLARQASVLRQVADHLQAETAELALDPTDARALAAAPPALAGHVVRTWLRPWSPEGHPPDAASVERVLAVARGEIRATEVTGGFRVARTGGRLRIEPPTAASPDDERGERSTVGGQEERFAHDTG